MILHHVNHCQNVGNRMIMIRFNSDMQFLIIAVYAIVLFTVPSLVFDKSVTPFFASITLVLVAVYVLLGLEVVHRTVLATFAVILSIILAITLGSTLAEESLDFIIKSIDLNTIGPLVGMMVIVGGSRGVRQIPPNRDKDGQGKQRQGLDFDAAFVHI